MMDIENIKDALEPFVGEPIGEKTTEEITQVLIPVIRKIMPQVLAQQICGVQPLASTNTPIAEASDHPEAEFPYWVKIRLSVNEIFTMNSASLLDDRIQEMHQWCFRHIEAFPNQTRTWRYNNRTFVFFYEADRIMFMLRFS